MTWSYNYQQIFWFTLGNTFFNIKTPCLEKFRNSSNEFRVIDSDFEFKYSSFWVVFFQSSISKSHTDLSKRVCWFQLFFFFCNFFSISFLQFTKSSKRRLTLMNKIAQQVSFYKKPCKFRLVLPLNPPPFFLFLVS